MAVTLVTGAMGSGKTHYVMKRIQDELKQGRKVYTNIAECKLDGVQPIPTNDKNELDWTLTPQGNADNDEKGALIVYDEAQKLSYFEYKKGEKLSSSHLLKDLETHRHKGYDLIFITQSPKFLHLHLLELVNEHYHVNRRFNRNQSEICLYRNKYEQNPMTKAAYDRAEDIFTVNYDKKLFEQYKSTEIVTNKGFRISRKLRNGLIIIALIFTALFYYVFFKDNKYLKAATGQTAQQQEKQQSEIKKDDKEVKTESKFEQSEQQNQIDVEQLKRQIENEVRQKYLHQYTLEVMNDELVIPASIIEYNNICKAYNRYGDELKISQKECKKMLRNRGLIPKVKSSSNTVSNIVYSSKQQSQVKVQDEVKHEQLKTDDKQKSSNEKKQDDVSSADDVIFLKSE